MPWTYCSIRPLAHPEAKKVDVIINQLWELGRFHVNSGPISSKCLWSDFMLVRFQANVYGPKKIMGVSLMFRKNLQLSRFSWKSQGRCPLQVPTTYCSIRPLAHPEDKKIDFQNEATLGTCPISCKCCSDFKQMSMVRFHAEFISVIWKFWLQSMSCPYRTLSVDIYVDVLLFPQWLWYEEILSQRVWPASRCVATAAYEFFSQDSFNYVCSYDTQETGTELIW